MTNEQLVIRIKAGIAVEDNMKELWQQNRGYISKIVNRYKGYAEEGDLQQEGYLGLCTAVDNYNPEEGTPFMTYAGHWIRNKMSRYIRGNGTIRLPEHMYNRVSEYKRMVHRWNLSLGREPTEQEIRHYLGLSQEQLVLVRRSLEMGKIASLDVPVGEEEDGSMYDLLPSPGNQQEDVIDKIQKEQLSAVLWGMVDDLPGQQGNVIRMRFQEGKTYQEVGQRIGTTMEGARQWQLKALRELRKPSKANKLRPFLYDDIIRSQALQGNGIGTFRHTWTSSTERIVLRMEEKELDVLNR